jgi:hypothetical protein
MKILITILYVSIPFVCAVAVGTYFGYFHYFEELKNGNDNVDAFRWAFISGLLFSPIGLAIGLIIDLFVWLLTNSPKTESVS